MEINTQQMEALLHAQEKQAQLPRKNSQQAEGFDALLNSQLSGQNIPVHPLTDPALTGVTLFGQMMETDSKADASPDMAVMQAAMDQAAGTLDLWDNYARALGSSGNTALRDAYALLEGIDGQLASLRSSPAMGKSAVFDGLVNELEILAATEKFKFNRGDYLG